MSVRGGVLWAVVLGAVASACKTSQLTTSGCLEDRDCGDPASAYRCEAKTGVCFCRTDEACPGAQFCNTAGFCQDRSGCEKNLDCLDPSLFCDTTSGQCLARGRCTSDLHCPLGEVCDTARSQCVTGCRSNGDCPGTSCRCGETACACTGTTPEELARCPVGVCDSQFCADPSFCRFGEQCGVPPDAGTARAQCYSDFDINLRPYCARCTSGGGVETCGTGANFCIIDTRTASTYCGADCSEGQACPRGYSCRDIRIVFTRWQCSVTQPCPADPSLPCATDAECRRGGQCLKPAGSPTGFCAGRCRIREGSSFGYCSCQVDSDCPLESCSMGECTITRRKCVTDDQCRTIRCVDFDGVGGCFIGQNCTPTNGLTCVEVQ
jgi:hypothetical protein